MSHNIGIIGLGSLGAAYASMAMDTGYKISFICNAERKQRYESIDFSVNGKQYPFTCSSDVNDYFDLILVTVKIQHLTSALDQLRLLNTKDTIIISVINGITSETIIKDALPDAKVLHAYTVKTDGQRKGHQFRYSNRGRIVFGAMSDPLIPWADKAEMILKSADIPHQKVENIEYKLWWKLMLNVGINQSSAILKSPYGEYQNEHVQAVAAAAMKEVVDISKAKGVNLAEEDIENCFSIFTSLNPDNKTSMLQDLEAGKKTEVNIFAGEVIELGKKYNIPTPVNTLLYHSIKYLEENSIENSSSI